MILAIIDNDGNITCVINDIEEYDLSKPLARSSVIDDIESVIYRKKVIK